MKPSVTTFRDVPKELNRIAAQGQAEYQEVTRFVDLLRAADAVSDPLKQAIARVAGLREEIHYGTPLVQWREDLPHTIVRQFARLAHTPAPRTVAEWKAARLPPQAQLAQRLALVFLSGYLNHLHQCDVCEEWFLGRRQAKTCSAACREKKSESRTTFKRQRRAWLLNKKHIPRINARLQTLHGPANRLRREKWENRLKDYQRELQEIRRKGK